MSKNNNEPHLTDEEKEMIKGVMAWLSDDEDRFPLPYPERMTPEDMQLVIDNRKIFDEQIYPLVEKIMQICGDNDIPFFTFFLTEQTEEHVTGGHSYINLPYRVCEIMALAKIVELPHDFCHSVIHNGDIYKFMIDQLRGQEDDDENE